MKPEHVKLFAERLHNALHANMAVPTITSPLSTEEKMMLARFPLGDLFGIAYIPGKQNFILDLAKNIAINVLTQVATEAIMSEIRSSRSHMDADAERSAESEPLDPSTERDIDEVIESVMSEDKYEMESMAEEVCMELDHELQLSAKEVQEKELEKPSGNVVKDKIVRKVGRQMAREYLGEAVKDHLKNDLKNKVSQSQKDQKHTAQKKGPVNKKQLREIAKEAKKDALVRNTNALKAYKSYIRVAVAMSDGIIANPGSFSDAMLDGSGTLAKDYARDRFIQSVSEGIKHYAPKAASVVTKFGSYFFFAIEALISSDVLHAPELEPQAGPQKFDTGKLKLTPN